MAKKKSKIDEDGTLSKLLLETVQKNPILQKNFNDEYIASEFSGDWIAVQAKQNFSCPLYFFIDNAQGNGKERYSFVFKLPNKISSADIIPYLPDKWWIGDTEGDLKNLFYEELIFEAYCKYDGGKGKAKGFKPNSNQIKKFEELKSKECYLSFYLRDESPNFEDAWNAFEMACKEFKSLEIIMAIAQTMSIQQILDQKKNIILQGAPGTGKTYATAELALSIIGQLPKRERTDDEKKYHKKVMSTYKANLIEMGKDGSFIKDGQIGFVTFHQSMDYEDFVEGIKPSLIEDESIENDGAESNELMKKTISYDVVDGIFKTMVQRAVPQSYYLEDALKKFKKDMDGKKIKTLKGQSLDVHINYDNISVTNSRKKTYTISDSDIYKEVSYLQKNHRYYQLAVKKAIEKLVPKSHSAKSKNYVLIIDEINRGNVSKIFGELISLLEADKRVGGDHPLTVTLPYSKEPFSVPSNLYIIGTMNTTDRSVGSIDYAVRRRFAFVTLEADESKIESDDAKKLFASVKRFLTEAKYDMDIEDLMVGHSYFMTTNADVLKMKWQYEILPLLMEYHKDGIIKESPLSGFSEEDAKKVKVGYDLFIKKWPEKKSEEAEK